MPKGDGCNDGCMCYGGKFKIGPCKTKMDCGFFKDCINDNKVLIRHLTVFPSDDSCNKCDCFDGKISCTNKECADPNAKCEPGKYCENSSQCGENGHCLGWQLGWA